MSSFVNKEKYMEYGTKWLFNYGNYGWVIIKPEPTKSGDEQLYAMYPIKWTDDDYVKVFGVFPSFPAVLANLSEIEVIKFITKLKEEIIMYGCKEC